MECSRQEYWSGLPFPTSGDLPHPGMGPPSLASSALTGRFFTTVPLGSQPITTIQLQDIFIMPKIFLVHFRSRSPLLLSTNTQVLLVVKNSPASSGDIWDSGSVPEWERSPGAGHGSPLQYSCLENLMVRGAWQATVHGVAKWLSMHYDMYPSLGNHWSFLCYHKFSYFVFFTKTSCIALS